MIPGATIRQSRIILGAAALVALAGGLAALSPAPVGVFWDDGVYVVTAKALATGQGYRYIHLPGAPAATHYPPLWPLLLSAVWRIFPAFPENVRWMKLLNPLLLAAGAAGATLLAARVARVPRWIGAAVVAATVVIAPMLLLSAALMSEPLCLALTASALATATLMIMRGGTKDACIAGALAGLAILTRSASIVLLPALATGLCWRRSRRASAVALGIALVIAVPWFAWSATRAHELGPALMGSYGPYTGWVIDGYRAEPSMLPEVVTRNASLLLGETAIVAFGALPRVARSPLLAILVGLGVLGIFLSGRRIAPLAVALLANLGMVLIWPYAPGRFVWGLLSLHAVALAAAVSAMLRRARSRRAWRIPAAAATGLAVVALAGVVRYDAVGFSRGWHRFAIDAKAGPLAESVGVVARLTAPGDTIATDVNLTAYLYTGRIGVPMNTLTVAEYLRAKTVGEIHAEYSAIERAYHPRWWIATAFASDPSALESWTAASSGRLRAVERLPNGGLAVRAVGR